VANHSLGGLRSLETIDAGDRVLSRLSPVQLWVVRETLERGSLRLPPSRNVMDAAKRLTMRGILRMSGDVVRYRPVSST
jgi:hypothetical protein